MGLTMGMMLVAFEVWDEGFGGCLEEYLLLVQVVGAMCFCLVEEGFGGKTIVVVVDNERVVVALYKKKK